MAELSAAQADSAPEDAAPAPTANSVDGGSLAEQIRKASEATLELLRANSSGQGVDGVLVTKQLVDMLHL